MTSSSRGDAPPDIVAQSSTKGIEQAGVGSTMCSQQGAAGQENIVSKSAANEVSGEEACCLLQALSRLNQVNIQRLGLTCMRVREEGLGVLQNSHFEYKTSAVPQAGHPHETLVSYGSRGARAFSHPAGSQAKAVIYPSNKMLSSEALLGIACGMVLLGKEGEEMAEQVLPGDVFRAVKKFEGEASRLLESSNRND
jgi:hypothetical protein